MNGPSRRSRAEQQAQTRTAILDAAAQAFAARGFRGASMQYIADLAGFTQGALYANFPSKAELFLALVDERMDRDRAEVHDSLSGPGEDVAGERGVEHAAERFRESREQDFHDVLLSLEFVLFVVRERPDLREALARRYRAADAEIEALIAPFVAESDGHGPSPAELALAQSSLTAGLGLRLLLDPALIEPERAATLIADVLGG